MIRSMMDNDIWNEELVLMESQDHFEDVWQAMQENLEKYGTRYIKTLSTLSDKSVRGDLVALNLRLIIDDNRKLHDKYHNIFDLDLFEEEYFEDPEGFKSTTLRKDCEAIRVTLNSRSEVLVDWQRNFNRSKAKELLDTFYNIVSFADEYNTSMDEDKIAKIDSIDEVGFAQMSEEACYQSGVLGYGLVSNILNHMYPRVFPGNYKLGIYSLYFLSGAGHGVNMPSESSEFIMVKDDVYSKTGTIEVEHNYYFPYSVFGLYSLRIYRFLENKFKELYNRSFPSEYRYLLVNKFYEYIATIHKADITTLNGNDDILKFNRNPW